jgi:hypothetical protein
MTARPRRTNVAKALRLACWNADGVRGRKLELEHFLSQHGVDICLLTETRLREREVFRLPNYVCHRTDRPAGGGGTAIMVRRGIDHYAVPVLGLTQLEATAIHVMLASGTLKILAVYLSPSRLIVESDLSACFGGGVPVLMVGDLNAKHVDWKSRLTTTRGKLLFDYASRNSCVIYGPDLPTTLPYDSSVTPDVLDIVITKDLTFPVYLTACSALSSDHLPVLIDTTYRSSFRNLPARPDYRSSDWVKFQASLEERQLSTPLLPNKGEIDTCVEEMSSAILEALAASTPKSRPRDDPRPPIPARTQDEIRLKNRLRRQWQITRDPAPKAKVNRIQRSVTYQLNEWCKDQ